uniref:Uncharacterized protein n=1 Tax=Oryza punctata TaxID=4537 RepID=A0A0E0LZE2_ORYPU
MNPNQATPSDGSGAEPPRSSRPCRWPREARMKPRRTNSVATRGFKFQMSLVNVRIAPAQDDSGSRAAPNVDRQRPSSSSPRLVTAKSQKHTR